MIALLFAILIDLVLGDPPNKYHPTAWIGRAINIIKPRLKDEDGKREKIKGALGAVLIITIVGGIVYALSIIISFNQIVELIITAVMLKLTIAIRSMEEHARRVIDALDDLKLARRELSMIVGRDTSDLDEGHILSAVIESISENITDGITSSLFYYSLFGIVGAFVYRAINTLDSMLGYKDEYYKNIGWFSSRLDTIVNYLPARLTAFITIIASMILGMEWKNALKVIMRDSKNTDSINSGWSMAGVAGALNIRLEKVGYYKIGEEHEHITIEHCYKAIRLMKVTVILFMIIVVLPLLILRYLLGWSL